ncbi:hypothetical protein INR49_000107 [Caranx melampygus]|nr:hypothetical protein INR49_000107 [Caranx melampygus]
MATADTGGLDQSSLQSEGSLRRSEESRLGSEESRAKSSVGSWESELTSIQHSLKFGKFFTIQSSLSSGRSCDHTAEGFQDNCCKREISSLEVFCINSPQCASVTTLHHLQIFIQQRSSRPLQEH